MQTKKVALPKKKGLKKKGGKYERAGPRAAEETLVETLYLKKSKAGHTVKKNWH